MIGINVQSRFKDLPTVTAARRGRRSKNGKTKIDVSRTMTLPQVIACTALMYLFGLNQACGFSPMHQSSVAPRTRQRVSTETHDFDEFVEKQAEISSRLASNASSSTMGNKTEFLKHQAQTFDQLSHAFAQQETISEDLKPIYDALADKVLANLLDERKAAATDKSEDAKEQEDDLLEPFRILDVACGTGALWPFLMRQADRRNVTLHIHGVDLSLSMVEYGKQYALDLLNNEFKDSRHEIQLDCKDIMDHKAPTILETGTSGDDDSTIEKTLLYDGVICNACWANFYSQDDVLRHISNNLLASHMSSQGNAFGQLFVTHPLGAGAVQDLHDADPITVPHTLPAKWDHSDLIGIPVETREFVQEVHVTPDHSESPVEVTAAPFYFACLRRVRHSLLPEVWRFRGPVAHGYGRGGKKLGFPTANLVASEFFQIALNDLETGVYVGWALIEGAQAVVHKAVVNVGYSPTFEGKENPEKMIEAHLMPNTLDDFYDKNMRLELLAYLRPEQKFASFPNLIAQIHADAADATSILDSHPVVVEAQRDNFFFEADWLSDLQDVNGDKAQASSYERINMGDYLEQCR